MHRSKPSAPRDAPPGQPLPAPASAPAETAQASAAFDRQTRPEEKPECASQAYARLQGDEHISGCRQRHHRGESSPPEIPGAGSQSRSRSNFTRFTRLRRNSSPPARPAIRQQPTKGRSRRGHQAIDPEVRLIVPHIDGKNGVHRYRDARGIEHGDRAHSEDSPLQQRRQNHQLPFRRHVRKKLLQTLSPSGLSCVNSIRDQ